MWPGQASPRAAGSCRQLCWQEAAQTPRAGTCPLPTAQVGKLRHGPARWGRAPKKLNRDEGLRVPRGHCWWPQRLVTWPCRSLGRGCPLAFSDVSVGMRQL